MKKGRAKEWFWTVVLVIAVYVGGFTFEAYLDASAAAGHFLGRGEYSPIPATIRYVRKYFGE